MTLREALVVYAALIFSGYQIAVTLAFFAPTTLRLLRRVFA